VERDAGLTYRLLSGHHPSLDQPVAARIATQPPVPTTSITSIYSKSDGIVA
jgi:hypothetical protein